MNNALVEARLHQLLRSPGGCALLIKATASPSVPVSNQLTSGHDDSRCNGLLTCARRRAVVA